MAWTERVNHAMMMPTHPHTQTEIQLIVGSRYHELIDSADSVVRPLPSCSLHTLAPNQHVQPSSINFPQTGVHVPLLQAAGPGAAGTGPALRDGPSMIDSCILFVCVCSSAEGFIRPTDHMYDLTESLTTYTRSTNGADGGCAAAREGAGALAGGGGQGASGPRPAAAR